MTASILIRTSELRASASISKPARSVVETLEDRRLLSASLGSSLLAFNSIASGNSGAAASPTQTVTLTNTGSSPIDITGITIANDGSVATQDATQFSVTNLG